MVFVKKETLISVLHFSVDKSKMALIVPSTTLRNVINQMRSAQLFSLIVQGVVLYWILVALVCLPLDSFRLSSSATCTSWNALLGSIDGRYDVQQLINKQNLGC
uniref:DUF7087 domain-containing protein n=1 Tax=Ditylenchus dipsaci TaxID=166011 RepID=A0A915CQS9_9BILA